MDIFSSAIALAVVIYAILNRAVDALNVLFASLGFVHFDQILSIFINSKAAFLASAGKTVHLG